MESTLGVVGFNRMDEGTVADYRLLDELAKPYIACAWQRVLDHLEGLKDGYGGYRIDRYQHSLQCATRAQQAGECEEMIVAALLHDVGDIIAAENHAECSAAVIRPYVSRHTYWMVLHHGVFQGYYFFDKIGQDPNARDSYRDHPAFELTERFCNHYDQTAFDPGYPTLAIDHFEPMTMSIFSRTPWGAHSRSDWPIDDRPYAING